MMLSGKASPDERARGLDLGVDDYLDKSVEGAELVARMRALVRRGTSASSHQAEGVVPRPRLPGSVSGG